jgi:hydroxymethylpyrimidine/phosphomethylpyrimidine kinase
MQNEMSIALTIAGFDPGSGAGVTADLKTFAAYRVYGVACISALTVQSTQGVRAVEPLAPILVRQTLDCLADDVHLSGVKIGMLGSAGVVGEVASFLVRQSSQIPLQRIVLDPVLRSTSGALLLEETGIRLLKTQLLSCVGWITPNIHEIAILLNEDSRLLTRDGVPVAAARLQEQAAQLGNRELNVVVTGGHLDPPHDYFRSASGEGMWFPGEKIVTNSTHGTGCAFSTALLSELISGEPPSQAVVHAKAYVAEALRTAYPVGKGKGPMNHLFRLK